MALGCRPLVPNKLSYPETVGEKYCYKTKNIVKDFKKSISFISEYDKDIFTNRARKYQYQKVINKIIKQL